MTSFAQYFSRNIRLRIWYIFTTTIPKKACFIVKVELPSVSITGVWSGRLPRVGLYSGPTHLPARLLGVSKDDRRPKRRNAGTAVRQPPRDAETCTTRRRRAEARRRSKEKEDMSKFLSRKKWAMPGARFPGTVLAAQKSVTCESDECRSSESDERRSQQTPPSLARRRH